MQECLWCLWFESSVHDFKIRAEHILSQHNDIADCLCKMHLSPRHQEKFVATQSSFDSIPLLQWGMISLTFILVSVFELAIYIFPYFIIVIF